MVIFHRFFINHKSIGVTSGVSLAEKIELEFESNLGKTDYIVKNRVQKQSRKNTKSMMS